LSDDKIVDLEEYRKEKNKGTPISTLKAFVPDQYYIYPDMGIMIHVLFITDQSHHFNEAVYVMEDQYGNFFADIVEEDTCEGWHLLHKDVFLKAVEDHSPPEPPAPKVG
tara:strand:- start:448 stop:774 length:327 start_codon:yes stop_codon:yes gene_type:complete